MKFALAGNPNCGKTTLFNALTGSTAHVGNWPGVTVDRKEGVYKSKEGNVGIIDLPGIYSLSPYTPEEVVSRNYLMSGEPDLVINILDATNLERNLYLTTQIMESDIPVVIALNMMDVLEKNGGTIDTDKISKKLGVPVFLISALRSEGIKELMNAAMEAVKTPRKGTSPVQSSSMAPAFERMVALMNDKGVKNPVFRAVKALEGDSLYAADNDSEMSAEIAEIKDKIELDPNLDGDFEAAVADIRYRYIAENCKQCVKHGASHGGESLSDRIDKVLTHKVFGIPIFLFVMYLIFHFTFAESLMFTDRIVEDGIASPGVMMQGWTEDLTAVVSDQIGASLESMEASEWVHGLVVDGVLAGLGAVLSFLPQIMMLFLFISIMEDTGYMARAAFLMDRLLRRFGLSGRAFLPLLMGFGCSVPAMMVTRTLNDQKERRLTLMLIPFFSCGAKLPIWSMFSAAIFPHCADKVVFSIYMIGILSAIAVAIILRSTILKGSASVFIMELPAYHLPVLKNLAIHLWDKMKGFVIRVTTVIAGATTVIWFLANFDFSLAMTEANSGSSIIGVVGTYVTPLFVPLGFASGSDAWKLVVAIVTGLLAKEMVVSTLGMLFNAGEGDALEDENTANALGISLAAALSPAAALSYMVFNLLSVPCMAAVGTARAELNSSKWIWGTVGVWMATAWIVAFIVYYGARLLGF